MMQNVFTPKNRDEMNLIRRLFTMEVYKLESCPDYNETNTSSTSLDDHWQYIKGELYLDSNGKICTKGKK